MHGYTPASFPNVMLARRSATLPSQASCPSSHAAHTNAPTLEAVAAAGKEEEAAGRKRGAASGRGRAVGAPPPLNLRAGAAAPPNLSDLGPPISDQQISDQLISDQAGSLRLGRLAAGLLLRVKRLWRHQGAVQPVH